MSATTSEGWWHCLEHARLMHGRAVGEKEELAAAIAFRQHRVEVGQYVQCQVERFPVIHVPQVFAAPAEGLASLDDLQAEGVDAAACEQRRVLRRPVLADHTGQPDGGKEAGGIGKEHPRPPQYVLARLGRRFDAIEGHRTNDTKRHPSFLRGVQLDLTG